MLSFFYFSSGRLRGTDVFACEAKVLCWLSGRKNSEVRSQGAEELDLCFSSRRLLLPKSTLRPKAHQDLLGRREDRLENPHPRPSFKGSENTAGGVAESSHSIFPLHSLGSQGHFSMLGCALLATAHQLLSVVESRAAMTF